MKNTSPNGSSVTLAELVLSAQAAANKAQSAPDQLGRERSRLEAFTASGFASADYLTWLGAFNAQIDMLDMFTRQDSPATAAAKKAAALAAQAIPGSSAA